MADDSAWRLFIAVPLPDAVTRLIGTLVTALAAEPWPVRWVTADTAHITLQFIGDTPPERAELLRLALGPVVARHAALALHTSELGVFPNPRRPRVIWLGLDGPTQRLDTIQRDVTKTLHALEFSLDDRPFHPHVTLGRLRDVRDQSSRDLPDAIARRLAIASSTAPSLPVPVSEVQLSRSFLTRHGARYEAIGRYPLMDDGQTRDSSLRSE